MCFNTHIAYLNVNFSFELVVHVMCFLAMDMKFSKIVEKFTVTFTQCLTKLQRHAPPPMVAAITAGPERGVSEV